VLALAPGLSRGEATARRVTIAPGIPVLRLELTVPRKGGNGPYRAVLTSAEGAEVWSGDVTGIPSPVLVVDVPADRVPDGDYELVLTALSGARRVEVASYTFGVLRQ
jgi:hypothetical protein